MILDLQWFYCSLLITELFVGAVCIICKLQNLTIIMRKTKGPRCNLQKDLIQVQQ